MKLQMSIYNYAFSLFVCLTLSIGQATKLETNPLELPISQAENFETSSSVVKSAKPGSYVTLPFPINATGKFNFEVLTPEGWEPITRSGEVNLADNGVISTTLRVPLNALANEKVEVTLKLFQDNQLVNSYSNHVQVQPKTGLSFNIPKELEGRLDEPHKFTITLNNLGNITDTVKLSTSATIWKVDLKNEVTLAPYESQGVEVTLIPTTSVGNGYNHFFIVEAQSQTDSAIKARASVSSTYRSLANNSKKDDENKPTITIGIQANLGAKLSIDEDSTESKLFYGATSNASGRLSDLLDFGVSPLSLDGEIADPFESYPTSFGVNLRGQGWKGALELGRQSLSLGGEIDFAPWNFALSGSYIFPQNDQEFQYNVRIGATSNNPDLDLQINLETFGQGSNNNTFLGAFYQRSLTNELALNIGTNIGRFTQSNGGDISIYLEESLSWQTQNFDLFQSYSTSPLLNFHRMSLSGGINNLDPFEIRAQSSLALSDEESLLGSSVTLRSQPINDLNLSLNGAYTKGEEDRSGEDWSITPTASYHFTINPLTSIISASYFHKDILAGDGDSEDNYQFNVSVNYDQLKIFAEGTYSFLYPQDEASSTTLGAELDVEYSIGNIVLNSHFFYEDIQEDGDIASSSALGAELEAEYFIKDTLLKGYFAYKYKHNLKSENSNSSSLYRYGASWGQIWTEDITSLLTYNSNSASSTAGQFSAFLQVNKFLSDHLVLSVGYTLTSSDFLDFSAPFEHDLKVSLSLTNLLEVQTPSAITGLFGGRKSGEIKGVAFVDTNFNNIKDPEEDPLPNIKIALGEKEVISNDNGEYRFRLSGGAYSFRFPDGLPATIDLLMDDKIILSVNDSLDHNLPFAPVTSLEVNVFNDTNRNGTMDEAEAGIPYGGIHVKGPIEKHIRTNSKGYAVISGLPTGDYKVAIESEFLPERFKVTTDEKQISLSVGNKHPPISFGAALPERKVVSTFDSSKLALFVTAIPSSMPAGAEVVFEALLTGEADKISIVVANQEVDFIEEGGSWKAKVRIPLETPSGTLILPVTATRGEDSVVQQTFVNVTQGKLFKNDLLTAEINEEYEFEIITLFKASTGEIVLPEGDRITLSSVDGYSWQGLWLAPEVVMKFKGDLIIDGENIGEVSFATKDF